jgi:hypothetical protein
MKRLLVLVALVAIAVTASVAVFGRPETAQAATSPTPYDLATQIVTNYAPHITDSVESSLRDQIAYAIRQYEYPCRQKLSSSQYLVSQLQSLTDQLRSTVSY